MNDDQASGDWFGDPVVPAPVADAARRRSAARADRDWATADRLRDEIEAAGWRVVDDPHGVRLRPAHPPTVEVDGVIRYGHRDAVPSRLMDAPEGLASIIVVVDGPAALDRCLIGLARHAPPGVGLVVVIDALPPTLAETTERLEAGAISDLAGLAPDVIRTSRPLGRAAAMNIGLRRTASSVVILLDPDVELAGDVVSPIVRALDDPFVAVAGATGVGSHNLRRYEAAPPGEVTAISAGVVGFRRADAIERGPLDERFREGLHLDVWWSLVLRDEGPDEPPRRALALADLPLIDHRAERWADDPSPTSLDPELARQHKRNYYRVVDRFGGRDWLGSGG